MRAVFFALLYLFEKEFSFRGRCCRPVLRTARSSLSKRLIRTILFDRRPARPRVSASIRRRCRPGAGGGHGKMDGFCLAKGIKNLPSLRCCVAAVCHRISSCLCWWSWCCCCVLLSPCCWTADRGGGPHHGPAVSRRRASLSLSMPSVRCLAATRPASLCVIRSGLSEKTAAGGGFPPLITQRTNDLSVSGPALFCINARMAVCWKPNLCKYCSMQLPV